MTTPAIGLTYRKYFHCRQIIVTDELMPNTEDDSTNYLSTGDKKVLLDIT